MIAIDHAIVLAAGLGTRMRPLTERVPKPLIPVAGRPLIDWCLDWLETGGVTDVVVNTSYLADKLEGYLSMREYPHVRCSREEPAPLETGGGILHALPLLPQSPFLAMNSDAMLPPAEPHPIAGLAEAWKDTDDFLMLLVPREQALGWAGNGDFLINEAGHVRRPLEGEEAPYIFTGIEIIHPRVFVNCPEGPFSLNVLWKRSLGVDGYYRRVRAIVHEGPWLNVGDLQGLAEAERYCAGASIGS